MLDHRRLRLLQMGFVQLRNVYIIVVKQEADSDLHVIIQDA